MSAGDAHAGDRDADRPPPGAAVNYLIPVEAPQGEVQVLSLGVADVTVPSLIGTERLVHWRVVARNQQDPVGWVLDARDQSLQMSDGTTLAPLFAEASTAPGTGRATIPAGQLAYLDLFFSAPGNDPPHAALTWRVRRGPTAVEARTVFERMPDMGYTYVHYRPAQFHGGSLQFGSPWCRPSDDGWSDWIRPYAGYCNYSYGGWGDGFVVARGNRRWNYQRDRLSVASRPRPVGDRWRTQPTSSSSDARTGVGQAPPVMGPPPAPPGPSLGAQDRSRWSWRLEEQVRQRSGDWSVVSRNDRSGRDRSGGDHASPAASTSSSLAIPPESPSSTRTISSSDSSPSWRSSPSASSGASSSSPQPSSPPAASSGGQGSVGSRWRSRSGN
jgi:hypothetical protein